MLRIRYNAEEKTRSIIGFGGGKVFDTDTEFEKCLADEITQVAHLCASDINAEPIRFVIKRKFGGIKRVQIFEFWPYTPNKDRIVGKG